MMRVVAFMPLKRNSVRLPEKNFAELGGVPLWKHTADLMARLTKAGVFHSAYIYGDEPSLLDVACRSDLDFLVPGEGCEKERPEGPNVERWIQYFTQRIAADVYMKLHCTSPFTTERTVREVLAPILHGEAKSACTVVRIKQLAWVDGTPLYDPRKIPALSRVPTIDVETGGVVAYCESLGKSGYSRCPESPALIPVQWPETIDINTAEDWRQAEAYCLLGGSVN